VDELIAAIERLLERGIVVEPTRPAWDTEMAYRIRLADENEEPEEAPGEMRAW